MTMPRIEQRARRRRKPVLRHLVILIILVIVVVCYSVYFFAAGEMPSSLHQSPPPLLLPTPTTSPTYETRALFLNPSIPPSPQAPPGEYHALVKENMTREAAIDLQGIMTRKKVVFFHLHKAGGTTLCHQAKVLNGMNAPLRNCNAPGDGPRTLREGLLSSAPNAPVEANKQPDYGNGRVTCADRAAFMESQCMHFVAIERWVDSSGLCPNHFLYILLVREPIKRIESNCRYERIQPEQALAWLEMDDSDPRCGVGMEWSVDQCGQRSGYDEIKLLPGAYKRGTYLPIEERVFIGTATVDNFYVRSLGGHDVFRKPAGTVTEEDLEVACARVLQFEVVIVLEDFSSGFLQLERLVGWARPTRQSDAHRSFGSGDKSIRFTSEQRQCLVDANQLDLKLYDFSARRSDAISKALLRDKAPVSSISSRKNWAAEASTSVQEEKASCKSRFKAWETKAKRDKERWLVQREKRRRGLKAADAQQLGNEDEGRVDEEEEGQ